MRKRLWDETLLIRLALVLELSFIRRRLPQGEVAIYACLFLASASRKVPFTDANSCPITRDKLPSSTANTATEAVCGLLRSDVPRRSPNRVAVCV